jgi:phosphate transport system substrate-binding protein
VTGDLSARAVVAFGRNSASSSYGLFKQVALDKGDFASHVRVQPGSASIVHGVGAEPAGIGYVAPGYVTARVRAVPVADRGGRAVAPTLDEVRSGRYPLAQVLHLYVNRPPGRALTPLVHEFLHYAISREGQATVTKDGLVPLSAVDASWQRAKLGN